MITWKELTTFVSPSGQQMLIDFVRKAQAERGAGWLAELKAEFPTFAWIADLVCNNTGEEAFAILQKEFPLYPLGLAKNQLLRLHNNLRFEIERKR